MAGATIRSSAEVDEVPGDKLEGSLHEVETSTLNSEGEIIKQSVKGTLTINNPSAEDRIYDIDVILDNAESTDIGGDQVSVDELEAGKNYSMKYKVDGKRMLVLRERLDTNPARSQERSLSVASGDEAGPLAMELEVENISAVTLRDVSVNRPLPDQIAFTHAGAASIDNGAIVWEVGTLAPGEKQVLAIEGTITTSSTKPIDAGAATATYAADATLSQLSFKELDAFCRGFTYMRVNEDERPDNWICQTIFENRSSFAVDLVKLQVRMKGSEDLLFDISDVPDDVHPNGRWESEERTVMAQSEPDFTYELAYTILPRATSSTEGTLTLESKSFDVLDASVEKTYSANELVSYRPQSISAKLTLTNDGSSPINLMRVTDDIPGLFEAPDISAMRICVDGKEMDAEQYKAEVSSGITLEKEHRSPDGDGHTLTLTIGTKGPVGLKPGKSLTIEYDLSAPDPTPDNSRVDAPARMEFSAERFGPVCGRDAAESPSLKVVHNRRRISAGKQAIPLGGKGRYEVLILFENNSDTALTEVSIKDVLLSNFEIKEWSVNGANGKRDDVEMVTAESEEGTDITWNIPVVGKGERIEVSFMIKGEGEVDAVALNRYHGAHFGGTQEDHSAPVVEEAAEEEAPAEEAPEEEAPAEEAPSMSWREDVLLRVMDAHGITDRDAFIAHAASFDHDDNGYLKKSELEDAAKAFTAGDEEEASEEPAAEEAEAVEEAPAEEAVGDKSCPICSTSNAGDAASCSACQFTFE